MSIGYRGKTTNADREVTAAQAQEQSEADWGELTGTVESFDPETQTISVKPDYLPIHDGQEVEMPVLQEVPVRFQRMGGFVVTTPVKKGDRVALRPQMRSSEEFHTEGSYNAPKDKRSKSLSDMEAFLDGGEPLTNPIKNFNTDNMEIRSEDGRFAIEMSEDGKYRMRGAEGNWFDLLAQLAELLASDKLNVKIGSSKGMIHELEHRDQYADIAGKLRGMAL
ncbi:Gp138 family membrane-puncturing spike protein [Roseibium alexandrii]|uniref:Phage protein Gp138 N-terminal domain-containing protein n=1 Tax=Roseibium alexandrii TaxID=388408 RepID=A0A0M6ZZY0_9HYPH|nr:Gp138 family membrane-puncturing spike protein [Roseibium alexandrii]CTQ67104.1 hypothetical protein LAX5112_01214 [Roseibium alexandrii]